MFLKKIEKVFNHFIEIRVGEVLGKGSFGVVNKGNSKLLVLKVKHISFLSIFLGIYKGVHEVAIKFLAGNDSNQTQVTIR